MRAARVLLLSVGALLSSPLSDVFDQLLDALTSTAAIGSPRSFSMRSHTTGTLSTPRPPRVCQSRHAAASNQRQRQRHQLPPQCPV